MTKTTVDEFNMQSLTISQATATTPADIKATKTKATSPTAHGGLVKLVKRFGNLLYATFKDSCLFFIEIEEVVLDLENYGETAIRLMSPCGSSTSKRATLRPET